jgi:iron complex transport system substrate-binding protein
MFHHAIIPALEKAKIPVLLLSINSYKDILDKLRFYGEITGNNKKAVEIISRIEKKVSVIKKTVSSYKPPRVVIIWGSPQSFNMALKNSFVGNLVEMLGGINIADDAKPLQSMPQYAPLSLEYVLAKKPDMIFLITHGNDEKVAEKFKKEIEEHPAWKGLDAVRAGRVHVLPYQLFGVNPAVRVTEAIEHISHLLYPEMSKATKQKGKVL